ncbi:cysteine hydrolase [Actinomadura barringtoniae]|uniref:Cysteine hydrolase n=1 Tax=Actinomadura barringtoniae TaxID=1427535 RepID=A0A939TFT0_9ACTN|nr:cysteine hydrolase family protein [Actinomadura barringtoniae]MBO2454705.1 cysteine hydrolase [Actinomadura barringtoniae]
MNTSTGTALIVIDVQESFRQRPSWQAVSAPDIAGRTARLVDAARAAGDLVVWVLHSEPGSGTPFDPPSGHVRLMDGLDARDGEPVITKTSRNAFTTTNLQQLLTAAGIRHLVVCGIQTEQCCETTARLAGDLGFEVTFVTDATATFPIEHRDAPPGRGIAEILADPATLQTADIIARTEYALAGRFATLAALDDLAPAAATMR